MALYVYFYKGHLIAPSNTQNSWALHSHCPVYQNCTEYYKLTPTHFWLL